MARTAIKKRVGATGGKRKGADMALQAAPSAAPALSSPTTPLPVGSSLPAVIPPVDTPVTQKRQRKQRWLALPKKSKIRAKAAAIMAMRIEGRSNDEIAEALNLSVRSIRQYVWIAGKNGWLRTDDPHEYAESVLIHKAVKGFEELLDSRHERTHLPDKEVILESMKGLGIFKDQTKTEAPVNQQANMLTINVVMPEGAVSTVRPGTVAGVPAYVEGVSLDSSRSES